MQFSEVAKEITFVDFARTFFPTHAQLATNGKNILEIKIKKDMPTTAYLKRSLVKRIANNFISNSLKHTIKGLVQITFSIEKTSAEILTNTCTDFFHIGTYSNDIKDHLCIEVKD